VVCLQETKVADFSVPTINELIGPDFDYSYLPSAGVLGCVLICWRTDSWQGLPSADVAVFSATVFLSPIHGADVGDCGLTSVYGPTDHSLKEDFLLDLEGLASTCTRAWLIRGDFNVLYQAQDKNNNRLNHRLMLCFCRTIDELQLAELHLTAQLYT